ncbi:MAG TPA: RdgB/HAM1 family non-canonical purine NTP pyrophosphatase [Candidatus Limnocylindria bacterium]|nr:RdgB/HAM1 family non-canonical purine NTP pyrophosphatase [Candidatus Limnocylindria bacterium]
MSIEIVLATFNRDKARELKAVLDLPGVTFRALYEFSGASVPPESGTTLLENARLKAEAAARLTGLTAIGDDTGLEVDALDGAPGIFAACFAGIGATNTDNVNLLLEKLNGLGPERRTARFRTVIVAVRPGRPEAVGEGVLEGWITAAPRGQRGFGYDPVFEITELGRTLAELSPAEKNQISHRAKAAHELVRKLGAA